MAKRAAKKVAMTPKEQVDADAQAYMEKKATVTQIEKDMDVLKERMVNYYLQHGQLPKGVVITEAAVSPDIDWSGMTETEKRVHLKQLRAAMPEFVEERLDTKTIAVASLSSQVVANVLKAQGLKVTPMKKGYRISAAKA